MFSLSESKAGKKSSEKSWKKNKVTKKFQHGQYKTLNKVDRRRPYRNKCKVKEIDIYTKPTR